MVRRMLVRRLAPLLLAGTLVAAGCGDDGGRVSPTSSAITDRPLNEITYDPSEPWVITAIDNHFHDAHPTPELDPDAVLIFKNAGSNLHNVTIVGTGFSRDIAPGEEITIDPIRSLMPPPGPYTLVCNYHASFGMQGQIRFATG